jgi:hypothetical protein
VVMTAKSRCPAVMCNDGVQGRPGDAAMLAPIKNISHCGAPEDFPK